jgi:tRNA 2-thiocytidine biosynthesis protein TtcA
MMERLELERMLITTCRKTIYSPFCQGIKAYELIRAGDRIAVCVSGGKDSFLLAKCMQELALHGRVPFSLRFISLDPGYGEETCEQIARNAQALGIALEVVRAPIFEAVRAQACNPCFLCARMRRGHLYHAAMERGCNKIALGHHYDDVIETTLMNLLYGCAVKTMLPYVESANYPGMSLIRPLYKVREADISAFWREAGYTFPGCACGVTRREEDGEMRARAKVKQLIARLKEENPMVERSIFTSMQNVRVRDVIGYTDETGYHRGGNRDEAENRK